MASVTTLQEAVNALDALAAINTRAVPPGQEGQAQKESDKKSVSISGSNASAKSKDLQEAQKIWVDTDKNIQDQLENLTGNLFKGRVVDNLQ